MNIGFIGLGSMGRPMSLNLVKAGHTLTVHDIRRDGRGAVELLEAGARWADTPKDASRGTEIIFTSLPGPREVEAVAFGEGSILEGASRGAIYIDLTTNSPTLMRKIHKAYRERGVAVLDAPVSQGSARAKYEGTLTIMVGGDRAVFERAKPVLEAIGRDHLIYCGEAGAGAICKIVNNLALFGVITSLNESLALGVRAGVPVETLLDVICQSSGKSGVADGLRNNLDKPRNFDNPDAFSLLLARKDVRLATELGRELDIPMEIANLVEQKLTEAVARGWGSRTSGVLTLVQEERANVDLRSRAQRELDAADAEKDA